MSNPPHRTLQKRSQKVHSILVFGETGRSDHICTILTNEDKTNIKVINFLGQEFSQDRATLSD